MTDRDRQFTYFLAALVEGLLVVGLLGVDVFEDDPGTGTANEPMVLTADAGLPVFSPELLVELPATGPGCTGDESNENSFDGIFLGEAAGGGRIAACSTGKGELSRILTLRA